MPVGSAAGGAPGKGPGPTPGNAPDAPGTPDIPGAPADDATRQLRAVPPDDGPRTAVIPTSAAGPAEGAATPAAAAAAGAPEASGKKATRVKRKRTGLRRLVPTWRMVLGTFLFGTLLLIGLFVLGYNLVQIPPANAAAIKQSNVFLYADGSQLARDGEVNRENVSLAQISKPAQHAVLAAEDRDFYTESAVDPKAMVRAAWNTATGKGKQSGSTITQQYVKNYYLAQEQTATRKIKEFFISIKLDREESKDHILEGYLNTSFFGRNAYGIQAAAQAYYGVDADELTAGQGAYLASLLNAPSEYDVIAHPENKNAAVARWKYVLDGMVKEGWLSESARAKTEFPTPKQTVVSAGMSGQRGYLVEAVKQYLYDNKVINEDTLRAGGYRITTTIQKTKQDAFVKAVDDQVMDQLDKKNRKVDKYVRVGGASIDPKTGKVLAMYGGIDFTKQYYNNATRRDYQVGSTFKPFVFTSAVQNDSATQSGTPITPNTIYDGTNKRPVQGWSGGAYAPENEDQVSYGDITVRQATDKSVNSVYAQMAVDVGPQRVEQTAIDLGLPESTPDMAPYPSIALGTATASVLDMTEAYATLANHGKHGTYTLVAKITKDGEEIGLPKQNVEQVVTREAADTTTKVLQSVVDSGTATEAQAAGRPAAGKTGTAEEDQAAWFAGYTPDLATVVSVMGQDPVSGAHKSLYGAMGLERINGGGAPAQIWAQFTKDALKGTPVNEFDLELQEGADVVVVPPSTPAGEPSTPGEEDDGGATGDEDTQGQTSGQDNGGSTGTPGTDAGATGGEPTDGGSTGTPPTAGTDNGGTGDGGTGDGGATTGTDNGGTGDGGAGDGGGGGGGASPDLSF
ncbi:transglycosylase domain-containing protein [Streptomyces sp. NPDC046862]|uniref:transglycosylase domain-containing protein n=1 Tax=Streptomyces sp. NPDC046862 TaxID=3154603 RepID=UPI0034514DE1